jgi:hypothetical protein
MTEDERVEADGKPLLEAFYRELLRSGVDPDDALSQTAEEQKNMRALWTAAKQADGV